MAEVTINVSDEDIEALLKAIAPFKASIQISGLIAGSLTEKETVLFQKIRTGFVQSKELAEGKRSEKSLGDLLDEL